MPPFSESDRLSSIEAALLSRGIEPAEMSFEQFLFGRSTPPESLHDEVVIDQMHDHAREELRRLGQALARPRSRLSATAAACKVLRDTGERVSSGTGAFDVIAISGAKPSFGTAPPIPEGVYAIERGREVLAGFHSFSLLYVEPRFRGRGLAPRLVADLIAFSGSHAGWQEIPLFSPGGLRAYRRAHEQIRAALAPAPELEFC